MRTINEFIPRKKPRAESAYEEDFLPLNEVPYGYLSKGNSEACFEVRAGNEDLGVYLGEISTFDTIGAVPEIIKNDGAYVLVFPKVK